MAPKHLTSPWSKYYGRIQLSDFKGINMLAGDTLKINVVANGSPAEIEYIADRTLTVDAEFIAGLQAANEI